MHNDSFDFVYNAEGDYYDLVVDKKIQKVVEELKALPHDVLIRYLTYWSEAIDSRKYVVESDLPHEEWYTDCCDYAASETDEERYMHAKCMAETLGHMLQDIKNNYPNKYPAVMRTVKSWKNYSFIGFTPTMREEIDKVWIEPNTWNDGKKAAMAFVPLLEVFMKQYEDGKNEEAAGNAFYLLERLARLHCKDADYFEPDRESHCSYYEFLLEAVCHILTLVMKDKRTEQRYSNAMVGILTQSICCMGRCFSLHLPVLRIFCMGMLRETRLCLGLNTCWRWIKTKTDKNRWGLQTSHREYIRS